MDKELYNNLKPLFRLFSNNLSHYLNLQSALNQKGFIYIISTQSIDCKLPPSLYPKTILLTPHQDYLLFSIAKEWGIKEVISNKDSSLQKIEKLSKAIYPPRLKPLSLLLFSRQNYLINLLKSYQLFLDIATTKEELFSKYHQKAHRYDVVVIDTTISSPLLQKWLQTNPLQKPIIFTTPPYQDIFSQLALLKSSLTSSSLN